MVLQSGFQHESHKNDGIILLIYWGKVDLVKKFISAGYDINSCSNMLKKKPLSVAIMKNNYELVEFLVEKGANCDLRSLAEACSTGDERMVICLLDHCENGANNINSAMLIINKQGINIRHKEDKLKMIELLLSLKDHSVSNDSIIDLSEPKYSYLYNHLYMNFCYESGQYNWFLYARAFMLHYYQRDIVQSFPYWQRENNISQIIW
ncbi:hypothetical protein C1645_833389 [Glomus cerebriforme]|uniref:Uncharacterized protein n=1 Tax=Glomus cerebriforme TaxID=658196 RepID=A0A397SBP2_9GLOM|nr:hypothetical protein C1645_833389 [Glomus cerebriforme]